MTTVARYQIARILQVGRPGDKASRIVDTALILLICLNILAVIMDSVSSFADRYRTQLDLFELFSVSVFSIEYLLRVWSAVETDNEKYRHPLWGRLRYMLSPMAIVDLLAILPFYLVLMVNLDLRFLRIVRVLRIFKLTRYSGAMTAVLSVLKEESDAFFAAFFVLIILLVLTSSGIYLLEHEVQPEAFGSIPQAMWWAMATLTTVGYGDVIPVTAAGKFFGSCITIIGMGMVALPAGILASGFSDQLRRRRETYNLKLDDALADGVITEDEAQELLEVRKRLGLNKEDAELLLKAATHSSAKHISQCPHCKRTIEGTPLSEDAKLSDRPVSGRVFPGKLL